MSLADSPETSCLTVIMKGQTGNTLKLYAEHAGMEPARYLRYSVGRLIAFRACTVEDFEPVFELPKDIELSDDPESQMVQDLKSILDAPVKETATESDDKDHKDVILKINLGIAARQALELEVAAYYEGELDSLFKSAVAFGRNFDSLGALGYTIGFKNPVDGTVTYFAEGSK